MIVKEEHAPTNELNMTLSDNSSGEGRLVVLLHAYLRQASSLKAVSDSIQELWPKARIWCPELPTGLFSRVDPDEIVCSLLVGVDKLVDLASRDGSPVTSIVIVGHSVGGVIGRKLYVAACGETSEAPFEPIYHQQGFKSEKGLLSARTWAPLITRIVLLAGMNRGWQISYHMNPLRAIGWRLGVVMGYIVRFVTRRWLQIFKLRRGAEFITQLRIQWLKRPTLFSETLIVQLLGSRDDVVSPEDNIDRVAGHDFIYLEVPFSGHADVVDVKDLQYGFGREKVLRQALSLSADALRAVEVVPNDEQAFVVNPNIDNVVFVIHGIRDQGFWTQKIARRVRTLAAQKALLAKVSNAVPTSSEWATETSSYGYFPMLPFLLPWYRRNKVEWLMDKYTEALARYPNAKFSYVGHSNGTYLIAKALELYPCCKFENVVFAGSVVRDEYDWKRLLDANQPRVKNVLNLVATSDWVVAFFPKFFQVFGWQDLGSAGHDGFKAFKTSNGLFQIQYLKGRHDAGIKEEEWDSIAGFVLEGKLGTKATINSVPERNVIVEFLGRMPYLVWGLILLFIYFGWTLIGWMIPVSISNPETRGLLKGLGLSAYVVLIWLALTRL
ncbi:alpha/beta fold hydrolase [Pseudomonas cichorii]|uniref:alpha/beta fold hydrolase n=1 Tax=Pseudomonas cichorii TaxID=36746 RepID=UPI001C8966F6|nr:alpha/beta hydrolase [Pseudomonas cichorii]MBX8574796.1 alpha/beta hydrolase [Pseudomonas cichorii]